MAIRTPKSSTTYQTQVNPSTDSPLQPLDAAPSIAAAGGSSSIAASVFSTLGDIAGKNAEVIKKADERNKQLEENYLKTEVEQSLISLGQNYKYQSETSDPLIVGTDKDTNFNAYKVKAENLLKRIDKERFPELYLLEQTSINNQINLNKTQQFFEAKKKMISINQANHTATINDFIYNLNENAALEYLNKEDIKNDYFESAAGRAQYNELIKTIKPRIENRKLSRDAEVNPENTLEKINAQLKGEVASYRVPTTTLKTIRTQILGIQKKQLTDATTAFFLNDNYRNALPSEQLTQINTAIDNGTIMASTGLAEIKRIENQKTTMTGDELITLRSVFDQIDNFKLNQQDNEITEILKKYTNDENYSQDFLKQLSGYVIRTRVAPTSRLEDDFYKSTLSSNLALIQNAPVNERLIIEETFINQLWKKFTGKADEEVAKIPQEEKELFIDLLNNYAAAQYETRLKEFMLSSEKMPTSQEISAANFNILNEIKAEFRIENFGNLIDEYNLTGTYNSNRPRSQNTGRVFDYNEIIKEDK